MARLIAERRRQCGMTDRRFVFVFPVLNLYEVIVAASVIEARHKLMNSNLAPFYGQAVLLSQ